MKSLVLITGAAGGLGKAFAAECASRGWDLFLTDTAEPPLQALADGIARLYNVGVRFETCNLTDPAARERFWETIRAESLRFHLLVNVAGLDFEGPFAEREAEELCTIVRLNVEAVVAMTRRALAFRDPARTFRIVNVSSLSAFYPMPVKAVYAASKRFLLDFSLALRRELKASDATVTALCPAGLPSNPPVIKAIEAQGVIGRLTTRNVGFVARKTIDRSLANRAVYIPGLINVVLRRLGSLVPRSFMISLLGRRWNLDGKRPKAAEG
ncbi:MAG: SDR family NAD(P)-dependent oxidoreductase [Spirochaetales bacterium]|nr:SDR family NAD(P)-dependent oxidoreductase [Spirochaetales bacterium]